MMAPTERTSSEVGFPAAQGIAVKTFATSKLWQACPQSQWSERVILLVRFASDDAPAWKGMYCGRTAHKENDSWITVLGRQQQCVRQLSKAVHECTRHTTSTTSLPGAIKKSVHKSFEAAWTSARLRKAKDLKYACVSNFLMVLDTGDARRKRNQLDSWEIQWPKEHFKSWEAADVKDFPEFRSRHGVHNVPGALHFVLLE